MAEKKPRPSFEFEVFFDNLITKGRVVKEKQIAAGFKVQMRPLSAQQQLAAEAIVVAANPYMPIDTVEKLRGVSIVSQAILSVNDVLIEVEGAAQADNEVKRRALHENLMKLPTVVLDELYKFYIECVKEQNKVYAPGEMEKNIENF